jgi:hypothetical protein
VHIRPNAAIFFNLDGHYKEQLSLIDVIIDRIRVLGGAVGGRSGRPDQRAAVRVTQRSVVEKRTTAEISSDGFVKASLGKELLTKCRSLLM